MKIISNFLSKMNCVRPGRHQYREAKGALYEERVARQFGTGVI